MGDYSNIVQAISTIGFPIVCCIAMAWYVKYQNDFCTVDTYRYETRSQFLYDSCLETFTRRYTSPSGDKLVAFGKYGYDG